MTFGLQLDYSYSLGHKLAIGGWAFQDLLPLTEEWLEDPKNLEAVKSSSPNTRNYKSLVDCIFCESFEKMRQACFYFYRKGEMPLKFKIKKDEAESYDRSLLNILKFVKRIKDESLPIIGWKRIVRIALEMDDNIHVRKLFDYKKHIIVHTGSCYVGERDISINTIDGCFV